MRKTYGALVIGAGIGGIRSALDLAVTGQKVALIDKRPNIGGILTQLDYQFPTDHCGMCKMLPLTERDMSSQFCMRKGLFHKNIDIYLSTELDSLEGDPGKFQAVLRQHSSFVDPNKCIGCGKCSDVCPVEVPNEFNAGLTTRSAIYLPIPHAIPNHFTVDLDNCQRCWQCYNECPTEAIDFMFDERLDFHMIIADPDPSTFKNFQTWLKKQNFPLHACASGNEVLDRLAAGDEDKLLFLDLNLKDPEPARVLQRSLELRPDLNVILLMEPGQEEKANALLEMGAKEILTKPLNKATLVPWLDKLYMRLVSDNIIELDVGGVIFATGFDCYDPAEVRDILEYHNFPDVVTSLEFERLCSSAGPSHARLTRPSDGKKVKKIAWLQCVGSRDLKKNADFCSSICCMISIKEALLAKKRTAGQADTTIFYMDMRTFGKAFQRYRDEAEIESGIRFINSRIHSVTPAEKGGTLSIEYMAEDGKLKEETYDMLVLGVGARPPAHTKQLAKVADIETNQWGFVQTESFKPARTSRLGVFAAGSCGSPKDISESVIQSSAASLGASQLINLYAPLKEKKPEPEPEYRNVSREPARTLITLCTSCPILEERIDVQSMSDQLSDLSSVGKVATVTQACTQAGWSQISSLAKEYNPNRVLIGACMPYAYVNKLRELGAEINLNPALMDVVDIYTPTIARYAEEEKAGMEKEIFSTLSMASVRLEGADPSPLPSPLPVVRKALVVGGGIAGMTAAIGIADHGYEVCLVEEEEELGGMVKRLHYTLEGQDPVKLVEDLIEQVEKHPNINIFKDARVVLNVGRAGKFMSIISTFEGGVPFEHGVTVLATGGKEARNYEYGYKVHKSVLTQLELEEQLASGTLDTASLSSVAMIQCVGSREEPRNYCSRICCANALKNIHFLKKKHPNLPIYVFYRDIMTYGFAEQYYTEARRLGVIFIRYTVDEKPRVEFDDGKPVINAKDHILGRDIQIQPDILVLSHGAEANDVSELVEILGVETNSDGFFQEAEPKWRPVDFLKQGVYCCGLARAPGNISETIASASAAAERALRILSEKRLTCGNVVAEVRHTLCSLCGRCIDICPYGARHMDMEKDIIVVDELLCQGCGSCAAVCPNSASILRGFTDRQVMSVIDAALTEHGHSKPGEPVSNE